MRIEIVFTLAEDVYHMTEKPISSVVSLVSDGEGCHYGSNDCCVTIYCSLLMGATSVNHTCTVREQTGFMEFSKEGNLIIGGVFSITSTPVLVDNDYQAIPYTYCTR